MSATGSRRRGLVYGAILAAAIVIVYWNSLTAPFLFDDLGAVTLNPTIRDLWSLQTLRPPADGSTTTGRPLLNLSYAVNYAIGGESVLGYHVGNVMIHVLAALVLMGIVHRTLAGSASRRVPLLSESRAQGLAFGTAALWALHPLQTETVTCIAQRSESLCSLFYLGTLHTFIGALNVESGASITSAERVSSTPQRWRSRGWLVASVIVCLLGMACKEVMVTAPVVILLYDRTFGAGTFASALRKRGVYYALLACTWLLLGWFVMRGSGARGASAGLGLGVSSWEYLLTQARALALYLKLSVWPHPLVLDYGTGVDRSIGAVWWQGVVVLGLLGLVMGALERRRVAGFLGAVFFLILAPSSSVVPLVTQTIAEHRMYLPLAALVALVATAVVQRVGRFAAWGLSVTATVFGVLTLARNQDYRDPLIVWTDNVEKYPASARAQNNLALELDRRGRADEAIGRFAQAAAIEPRYVQAYYGWGLTLLKQGQTEDAIRRLRQAVELAPNHADAQLALGNALVKVGSAADALPHYEAALAAYPAADVHYNLGVALVGLARDDDAARHFASALQLQPDLPEAQYQLGRIAERGGRLPDAISRWQETLRLAPNHGDAHRRVGMLFARAGDFEGAARHFEALVRNNPQDAEAWTNLGNTFLARGQPESAITCYERTLQLRPGDERSLANLQLAREALAGR